MNEPKINAHLAAIIESSDDAIISKDLNGVIQSFNPAAERMFGYTAAEIIGRPVTVLIPHERQDEEAEILARLRLGQRIDHYETVRVAKNGRRIDISLTVSPVYDATGKVIGASKVARDITERKLAAAAMEQQKEWFRVTLNSIGDAVIASDRDMRVTFINHEAERLTGWKCAEAEGRPLAEVFRVIHEETRMPVDDPVRKALALKRTTGLAHHAALIARDGTEWPIADSASPIIAPGGSAIGVVVVFREISESKRSHESARLAAIERERLLQNERAARSEAEKANRVKDDFVAMVSHELRTPLNAILGWTELLKRTPDPKMLERGLDVIVRNTRLQAQLITDLLDVSRIVSGKLHLELDRVELDGVVRNSIEALLPTATEKGVAIVTRLDERPTPTLGDPARLQQIVWNLVSNAVKFTPAGGSVTVETRCLGSNVQIVVTDTGVGIKPELLPDIFERFRQGSALTTRRFGGLGLGLSISRHLTELHGGTIWARSDGEGRGATFTVELPSMTEAAGAELRAQDERAAARAGDVSLRDMRVLVVEDEVDTRDLIRRLLESHRAQVSVATTTPEALERLTAERPDLVISDIGLPDLDGYELIRRIRRLEGPIGRVPAVALTAYARLEDRTRALKAGYNAHVPKPVEPAELVITVGSFTNLISAGRGGGAREERVGEG